MATEIRIKRSAVSGSVPTHSTNINTGEIALNMADRNMYYSDGTTVKHIKGHHIGTSAPTTPTPVEGDIWYDTTNNVLKSYDGSSWSSAAGGLTQEEIEDFLGTSFLQAGNGVTMTYDDANNELLIESDTVEETVKNVSGGSLAIGTVVYQSGSTGTIAEVQAADADVASKMPAIGILAETLADQAEGKMVLMGKISGLDTSSFTAGDTVYVSTTAGTLTTTPPTGETGLIQNIGKVIKVHASNGVIVVTGAGRTNATPNLDSGKFFLGNGSNQAASATFSTEVQTVGDARYLLDSELTSEASVKALDQGVATTDSPTFVTVTATDFNTTSDRQFKTNITTIEDSLNKVTELRGVEFDWVDSGKHTMGFIAQEVEEVIPDLVTTHEDNTKSVKYSNITAVLVEAIKELKAEVDELKKQINKA